MKAPICDGCYNWKLFKEKCWFFWEGKTECSKFRSDEDDEGHYKRIMEDEENAI